MRLIFMGTPSIALPVLDRLACDHEIITVYTKPDTFAGRGRQPIESPVKHRAVELGLTVEQPESFKDTETISTLKEMQPEIIVVVAYGKILPEQVLNMPPAGCINVHFSLLPYHRGASPLAGAILAGDVFTGVSIILMDRGMDTGPVLSQCQVPLFDHETSQSLGKRLSEIAAKVLPEVLSSRVTKEIMPRSQNNDKATYSAMVCKEDGRIDWNESAENLWRKSRAYYPWPGIYTNWKGKKLTLSRVIPLDFQVDETNGRVVELFNDNGFKLGITTGKGTLAAAMIQIEGKKAISSAEFIRGRKDFIGSILPS